MQESMLLLHSVFSVNALEPSSREVMAQIAWLVPLFPGLAALANGFISRTNLKGMAGLIATCSMVFSFLLSVYCLISVLRAGPHFEPLDVDYYNWISVGSLHIPFGVYIDPLTIVMMMVVSFVGTIIFIYAMGYMEHDKGYGRFFTYMPLFTFFMFLLVMGNSIPVLFIGWEGVGLCSYLLIGYFYDRDYAADAGKKAFIMNRIGDFAFVIGMLILFWYLGSLKYVDINLRAPEVFAYAGVTITIITLLLFFGATGKSAQIPLFVWLPDAMAGPTPVSALIHAATMVTAGVYMIARLNILFSLAPSTLTIIGVIGGVTALMAASIALVQRDSKKILAYSTVSQLGYMFLACGSGAYIAAIFHLMTHAFFKACLFLGAGSVLHAFHRDTDVDVIEAGGLRKYMPYTRITFLISTIAIAGIPPLAGFFSKDEILWEAFYTGRFFLWFLGILTALFTAFYMFRLYNLLFSGEFRGTEEQRHHLHESPAIMWMPLMVLAFFAITIGWLNMPIVGYTGFHDFMHSVTAKGHEIAQQNYMIGPEMKYTAELIMAVISVLAALTGIVLARLIYVWAPGMQERMKDAFSGAHTILMKKYSVDEMYQIIFVQNYYKACRMTQWSDDNVIIAGLNGLAEFAMIFGIWIRQLQSGIVLHYAMATLIGAVFLTVWLLICF